MVDVYLIAVLVFSFLLSFVSVRFWISRALGAGLSGKDIHKLDSRKVAEMGGLAVLLSFLVGSFLFVAIRVFGLGLDTRVDMIFATVLCVLIAGIIGMVDDILGWKIGLKQWQKPVFTLIAAFPVIAIDAGVRIMSFPLIGEVDLGLFYPFFVIPAFIIVASNASNMLAGFNGLESGMSLLMSVTLGYFAYINGYGIAAFLCALWCVCVFAFWLFNKYPARVFPGDTFTYASGAFLGAIAIFADLEKVLIILFVPFAIEFFLKLRGRFSQESFGKILNTDNSSAVQKNKGSFVEAKLGLRYHKLYSLTHVGILLSRMIFGKATERLVVYLLYTIQLLFVGLAFVL